MASPTYVMESEVSSNTFKLKDIQFLITNAMTTLDAVVIGTSTNSLLQIQVEQINTQYACLDAIIDKIRQNLAMLNKLDDYDEIQEIYRQILIDYAVLRSRSDEILGKSTDNKTVVTNITNNTNIKLPSISLPHYSGKNLSEWMAYRDLFRSLVHDNPHISNIEKFQYLITSLSEPALSIVKQLPIASENYAAAWNALSDRYDDVRYIATHYVNKLLTLKNLPNKPSPSIIADFTSQIKENYEALQALSIQDKLGFFIMNMVLRNLDLNNRLRFESEQATGSEPTLMKLLDFLKRQIVILEKSNLNRHETSEKTLPSRVDKAYQRTTVLKTNTTFSCTLCKGPHFLFRCTKFLSLSAEERVKALHNIKRVCYNCLSPAHFTGNCESKTNCRICNKRHNTLLHIEETQTQEINKSQTTDGPMLTQKEVKTFTGSCQLQGQVLLPTAAVIIMDKRGQEWKCRALLDCGSQSHFITKTLCKKLGININKTNISVSSINNSLQNIYEQTDIVIKSRINNQEYNMSCFVVEQISDNCVQDDSLQYKIPYNIDLADPEFSMAGQIDILIGSALFWDILKNEQMKLEKNGPILQNTVFGWVVAGNTTLPSKSTTKCHLQKDHLKSQLQNFWELEELPQIQESTLDEIRCEEIFKSSTRRLEDGRFEVAIPFKVNPIHLGKSRQRALHRFLSLEKRLQAQPAFKEQYKSFMNEYQQLNHMTRVAEEEQESGYFLPHHGILKEDSLTTKLRVVFDGSAATDNGTSLNSLQYCGANLQENIVSLLIRFRQHLVVFTTDVTKMYRQIRIRPADQKYQKILWRENPGDNIQEYCLTTVTYGTKSAPFLAIRCIKKLAKDNLEAYPEAAKIILRDFYVDDLLSGADTIKSASKLCIEISEIMNSAGFQLHKWCSNKPEVLEGIPQEKHIKNFQGFNEENCKTLGLQWDWHNDTLNYKITPDINNCNTKRSILSEIFQIFDPLGLLAPCIITYKLLIQWLWTLKIGWDDEIPEETRLKWHKLRTNLHFLNKIKVPRHIICESPQNIELHGFCDSSESAYGACVYARSIATNGDIKTVLICAKSKVSPTKKITIPRLELCGAVTLARLMQIVTQSLTIHCQRYYWTDSQITLAWINSESSSLQTFVSNRVGEIQRLTDSNNWSFIKGSENPADLLTRGVEPNTLAAQKIWWHGPTWLCQERDAWPELHIKPLPTESIPDIKQKYQVTKLEVVPQSTFFKDFSSLTKLLNMTAYCLRFAHNCRNPKNKKLGPLSTNERKEAHNTLIRLAQKETFSHDIQMLNKGQYNGKIKNLNPFIDESKLLRVGGRLSHSQLDYNAKHPLLLSSKHPLSTLIFRYQHILLMHAGPQLLLYTVRQKYWVLSGRNLSRKIVRECIPCFKSKPITITPLMGDLPSYRCTQALPFTIIGTDYAGPFMIKETSKRKPRLFKCYICVFICLVTKAVHIEPVTDLTTESFIATLKRFTSRRGIPQKVFSDNGRTYVRASKDLKELGTFLETHEYSITNLSADIGIEWNFIPPYSPSFGGVWEASIKSVKHHLKRILHGTSLTFERLLTFLANIEGILNSRPISPLSSDPNDLQALSPAHFLIGRQLTSIPETNLETLPLNRLSVYQQLQQLHQSFWKRWSKEYLSELQSRSKWSQKPENVKEGALVLLKDDHLPSTYWRLGRIIKTIPGKDGIVRVVSLKTSSGLTERAVTKICPLPIETN